MRSWHKNGQVFFFLGNGMPVVVLFPIYGCCLIMSCHDDEEKEEEECLLLVCLLTAMLSAVKCIK